MIIVSRNRGGAYIICDLDGTLAHAPVAAFRVVPYFARHELNSPDLEDHIDISTTQLRELERSTTADPDNPEIAEPAYADHPDKPANKPADSDEEEERVSVSQ